MVVCASLPPLDDGRLLGVIGLMTVAGVLVGVSQLHGRDGNPLASFLVVFVPVLVAVSWVIAAVQPQRDVVRNHVLSWSGDLGIAHAVHNLGEHVAVLAFGRRNRLFGRHLRAAHGSSRPEESARARSPLEVVASDVQLDPARAS